MNEEITKRYWQVEVRAKEGRKIKGKIFYDRLSSDLGGFKEKIKPGALKPEKNTYLLWSHDAGKPLASTSSNTLVLNDTYSALEFEAKVPDTQSGRDALEMVKSGIVQGVSFGFIPTEDTWSDNDGEPIREILEATLSEISLVTFPAYSANIAEARNKFNTSNEWMSERKVKNMKKVDEYFKSRFDSGNHNQYIAAIVRAGITPEGTIYGTIDNRLRRSSGLDTIGFNTPESFMDRLLFSEYSSAVVKKVNFFRAESNKILSPQVLSKDRSSGQYYQGLTIYRVAEANEISASKPKIEQLNYKLKKTAALCWSTDELFEDVAALEKWLFTTMGSALTWDLEGQIIRGAGHNEMLGLLNCDGKIRQDKESGQSANTIVYENLEKMCGRILPECYQSKFTSWLISQTAIKQVQDTCKGTGAYIYKNADGEPDRLFGFPVIISEWCSNLGSEGDIILSDLAMYQVLAKAIRKNISGHLSFLTDESAFRLIFQADGMPVVSTPITPRFGSERLSSIVTLETRS